MVAPLEALFIMNALQVFSYKGSNVTFSNENGMWVNATEMAKPFDKFPYDWLRLQSSKDFLSALVSICGFNYEDRDINYEESSQFIKTIEGRNGGTWFHEDVAIEFARWLSPAFAIWCNDIIKKMLMGTLSKYPMTSDEAIAYGYGKALEKINRQSTTIARQSKLLQKYKSRLESEKEAKRLRLTLASETKDEDVARWLSESGIKGVFSLSSLFVNYSAFCEKHGISYDNKKKLSSALRNLGFTDVRKARGIYFII